MRPTRPTIFRVSQGCGPTRTKSGRVGRRVSLHCNVKMIYESVVALDFVTIRIFPILQQTKNILTNSYPSHSSQADVVLSTETFLACRKLLSWIDSIEAVCAHSFIHIRNLPLHRSPFPCLPHFLLCLGIFTLLSNCRFRRNALPEISKKLHIMIHDGFAFRVDSDLITWD